MMCVWMSVVYVMIGVVCVCNVGGWVDVMVYNLLDLPQLR